MTTAIIIILSALNIAFIAITMRQQDIIDELRGRDTSDEGDA